MVLQVVDSQFMDNDEISQSRIYRRLAALTGYATLEWILFLRYICGSAWR